MAPLSNQKERGSATLEFCLSSLIWMPLLLGLILFGFAVIQAQQVSQLSRDSGHMYANGINFSSTQNAALLGQLASALNIQQNSGSGAIVLSRITLITNSDCATVSTCANNGKYVFTDFYVYGNSAYARTQLGSPSSNYLQSGGASISMQQYLSDPTLVATNFSQYLTFTPGQPGQYAYVSEVTVNSQTIGWNLFNNTLTYARTFF